MVFNRWTDGAIDALLTHKTVCDFFFSYIFRIWHACIRVCDSSLEPAEARCVHGIPRTWYTPVVFRENPTFIVDMRQSDWNQNRNACADQRYASAVKHYKHTHKLHFWNMTVWVCFWSLCFGNLYIQLSSWCSEDAIYVLDITSVGHTKCSDGWTNASWLTDELHNEGPCYPGHITRCTAAFLSTWLH